MLSTLLHLVTMRMLCSVAHLCDLLRAALEAQSVPHLAAYTTVKPEQKYGQNSRIDFLLQGAGLPDAYVEVKSVTLSRMPGLAEFPDSVTARGAKHLSELATMVAAGHRAVMLYLVQRTDCSAVTLAADIDPTYKMAFDRAHAAGVQALAQACKISPQGIDLGDTIPFQP